MFDYVIVYKLAHNAIPITVTMYMKTVSAHVQTNDTIQLIFDVITHLQN